MSSQMPSQGYHQKSGLLIFGLLFAVVGFLFAFKTLAAIPLTSLWNDELRTVEKSFQPSLGFLFRYLRHDVHPPLYYALLWGFGKLFGETVAVLRSFSWVCYIVGALATASACWAWGRSQAAAGLAAVFALALPFTVRYAVEGKAYALLYALIALATFFRIRQQLGDSRAAIPHGIFWSAAALTHYYGMGLLLSQALLDRWRGRPTVRPLAWALVAPTLWMLVNLSFLLGSGGRTWIQPASPDLIRRLLRLALGVHWPLVLLIAGLVLLAMWWRRTSTSRELLGLVADWGLDAGLLLLVGSYLVSMVKPSAIDRYYIVLVPASIGVISCWLGAQVADAMPGAWRRGLVVGALSLLLVLFWTDSYRLIMPSHRLNPNAHRKGNDFRTLALIAAPATMKFSPQSRQLNAYDHVLIQENVLRPTASWHFLSFKDAADREGFSHRIARSPGAVVTLGFTGRRSTSPSALTPVLAEVESQGLRCSRDQRSTRFAKIFSCRPRDPA